MTVNYYLDTTSSAILLVVGHQGKKFRKSMNEVIKPANHWDSSNQRVRSSFKNYEDINKKLESKKSYLEKLIRDYETIHAKAPSIEYVKQNLEQHTTIKEEKTFGQLLSEVVNYTKDTKSKKSHISFQNLKNRIGEFEIDNRFRFNFENINASSIESFKLYLARERKCNHATIKLRMTQFSSILKYGVSRGYLKGYDVSIFKVKNIHNEGDKIYLTEDEIKAIENLKNLEEKYQKTRDIFLLQYYTGLRYSDILKLKPSHVDSEYIRIVVQKTKKRMVIPLTKKASIIIEKYRAKNLAPKMLPAYHSNYQNLYLKELCAMAEINEKVEVIKFVGNQRNEEELEKWKLVSTHTGRRSFATNYILRGGKIEHLSTLLGHADIKTTQKYLRHAPEVIAKIAIDYMQ